MCKKWQYLAQNDQKCRFGPILAIFGPKSLIFMLVSKSFGTNITENHLDNLSALFFGQALVQMGQKCRYLAQNASFGPNIGIFGPLDLMRDQKTMRTSCLGGFLLCWYQNFYLLRLFGPKTAKFGPRSAFLVILGQILPFFAHFVQCPTKNQCEQGA